MSLSISFSFHPPALIDAVAFKTLQFGTGYGEIFLNNVVCTGSENDLLSCGHGPIGVTGTCTHNADGAVRCQGKMVSTI